MKDRQYVNNACNMTEAEINQLNRYLYQELEDTNKLIKALRNLEGDTGDLLDKRNKLQMSLNASLNRLEALWEREKEEEKLKPKLKKVA